MDEKPTVIDIVAEEPKTPATPAPGAEWPVKNRWRISKIERLKCWPEVLALLENGEPVDDIATYIQVHRGEYEDVGRQSLKRCLWLWIKRNRDMVPDRVPMVHAQLAASAPRIDEMDGLNMVLALQMDRVSMFYDAERRSRVLNPRLEKEMRLVKDILHTMAQVRSTEKRYAPAVPKDGGGTSVIQQIEALKHIYENKYGVAVARVILADESRRKVLNAVEHLRRGNSQALQRILEKNAKKAEELKEQERKRAQEEATVIDVGVEDGPE